MGVGTSADVYLSSVVLDGTTMEFVSYPIVSRLRKFFSLPARCVLLSIGISHPSLVESGHSDLLNRSRILPLAFMNYPHISPVLVGRNSNKDSPNSSVDVTIKEIVLGVEDDCLDDVTKNIFHMSDDVIGPCVTRFSRADSAAACGTNLRIIPGFASSKLFCFTFNS